MDTVLAVLLVVTAVGTTAYWLDFFFRGTVHVVDEEWYLRFERSFPVADAWMSIAALIAAIGLLTDSGYGRTWGLVAAGALVFLGLMDLTFNYQNALFKLLPKSGEMWAEVVIIAWCLALGTTLLVRLT